ncbi:MAG: ribonuclease H-like domain-containing protein, partial [Chloroflexi bacterium]|nr:ribonuclease H-like domain-containing protein [Chloroflexota bacterium]
HRLRRLGVQRGAKGMPPTAPKARGRDSVPAPIESVVNGSEEQTKHGSYFLIENEYDLDHKHGIRSLGAWLHCDLATTVRLSQKEIDDLTKFAFFDIETTGLAGGARTLAFLIGVGVIEEDRYILRQYFLRDPSEEAAMLSALESELKDRIGVVTYNGRSFDVPIVESRFVMSRRRFNFRAMPNLDLLPFARRLWRGQYENCSLGTLEKTVLGGERSEDDVPGMLIPQMYVDYLRTGDANEMKRVIYHNAQDILSMTALASHIVDIFADPLTPKRSGDECLRLALWHDDNARVDEAEAAYNAARQRRLTDASALVLYQRYGAFARVDEAEAAYNAARQRRLTDASALVLYQRYGAFLKKENRRAEAVSLWESWADLDSSDPEPCIELSKFYEWETKEIKEAKEWASRAMMCLTHWRKDWRRDEVWNEVKHRLERLKAKG